MADFNKLHLFYKINQEELVYKVEDIKNIMKNYEKALEVNHFKQTEL